MSADEGSRDEVTPNEGQVDDLEEALWRLVRSLADVLRIAERRLLRSIDRAAATRSPWMTTEQAAEHSAIPKETFGRLAARGAFRRYRPGKKGFIFHRDELDEDLRRYRA